MSRCLPIYESHMAPRPELPAWEWAAENIDYSRASNYDTPYRGKFDQNLMPFWCEPLEVAHDPSTRELVVLKCSRAGYSENLLLTDLRYVMDCAPEPTLYVTGRMDLAQGFLDRRVKRGMALAPGLRDKFKASRCVGQDIQLADMDFRATWATSDSATSQDGWARIHADETSKWEEFVIDQVRRRASAYPFHHIIFGGSIKPDRKGNPAEDPTLKLYMESDQRKWMMTDPLTGNLFIFQHSGIHWPEQQKTYESADECDLDTIADTAWYETPDGTRIDEAERMDVVRSGKWVATNPIGTRAGFKVVAPMVPFSDCSFGNLAKEFLSAKHRLNITAKKDERHKNTIRTYFAEYWAEAHRDEEMVARDETLVAREAEYEIGNVYVPTGFEHYEMMTTDVQKYHYWWLARAWSHNPKTGEIQCALLDFGNLASIIDIEEKGKELDLSFMGTDIGYALKATEVGTLCAKHTDQAHVEDSRVIALRGSDQIKKMPIERQIRDAFEGSRSASRALFFELTWASDVFRSVLLDAMNGKANFKWWVPSERTDEQRWSRQYVKQVTSTRKADGEWIVAGHGQDHLFDCEVMQIVLAQFAGLIQ